MKKSFQCVAFFSLLVLGIVFAVYYGSLYVKDAEKTVYLCLSIISALEATMTVTALLFFSKSKKYAWIRAVYVLIGILCIPVLLFAAVWILHWIGFDLLPPPQR